MMQYNIYFFIIVSFICFSSVSAQSLPGIGITFPDLSTFDLTKLSQGCSKAIDQLVNEDRLSLIRIIDASSKLESGITEFRNFFFLGDYGECLRVANATSDIYGKYCIGTLPLSQIIPAMQSLGVPLEKNMIEKFSKPDPRILETNDLSRIGFQFGLCLPDRCSAEDFQNLYSILVFSEDHCFAKKDERDMSAGAIATLTILAFFVALSAISTAVDLYFINTGKKSPYLLLVAFSVYSNGKKLFSSTCNSDQLLCLNGLRAISMMWVLISHEYLLLMNGPLSNFVDMQEWMNNAANMFIVGASVSVDTFFTIGGFVTVYVFLRSMDKGAKFNIFMYYIHRYVRLTPLLAIIILIHAELIPFMGNGPFWKAVEVNLITDCKNYWWSGLLYLQNYFHGDGTCVPQAWYLSVDFQLFLLSPIVLIPLTKRPKIGVVILGILILAGILTPFGINYYYKVPAMMTNPTGNAEDLMWKYYKQTYARFGPYVIGMLAGYYVYKLRKADKVTIPKVYVIGLWLISLAGLTACVYAPHDLATTQTYDRWQQSIASSAIRNGWAVALCILIILCVTGYGGPIDWFLSISVFQLINKISYAMYLIHYAFILIRYATTMQPILFSNTFVMWYFWADFAIITFLSIAFCLVFESPMIIVEKVIFVGAALPKTKKTEVQA